MASLYKNNGIWYIAVSHNGTRKCRSLKTKDNKVAKSIKSNAETIILQKLGGFIKSNAKLFIKFAWDVFILKVLNFSAKITKINWINFGIFTTLIMLWETFSFTYFYSFLT